MWFVLYESLSLFFSSLDFSRPFGNMRCTLVLFAVLIPTMFLLPTFHYRVSGMHVL